jgi:hypothetical protein
MKIFTVRINSKPSFLVHEKICKAFAFTSRCFKRYQRLFMLQTTKISYVFWWLKLLLTAYLPIQIQKMLTIRLHSSQQFSETWVHIVGDGGVLEKKLWAKRFGAAEGEGEVFWAGALVGDCGPLWRRSGLL